MERSDRYRTDCRLFTGYRPCPFDCRCEGCAHYRPKSPRALIVRVHQLGNIVKSSPVVYALRKRFDDPWIAWLASPAAAPLVRANPLVDEVIEYRWEVLPLLSARSFDLVLSLEANPQEAALAQAVPATLHLGYGVDPSGSLRAFNPQSQPYTSLSLSDEYRFGRNRKTLAELCFDLVGVRYEGERYLLRPSDADVEYARAHLRSLGVDPQRERLVALATGGNTARFETKDWPPERFAQLARLLARRTDARLLLVGGEAERAVNDALAAELGELVVHTGCGHSITQFCALLSLCELVVSADSFPLHAATAVGAAVVGIFGPTPPAEVAVFDRGVKVVTQMDCGPCYIRSRAACPHGGACMAGIAPETVLEAAMNVLDAPGRPDGGREVSTGGR